MIRKLFFTFVFLLLLGSAAAGVGLWWGYNYITRDLPNLTRVEDYQPDSVSLVLDRNGEVLAEIFEKRRYPLRIREVPDFVKDAFVAAEDATFYSHPGIDIVSILRAFVKNIQVGEVKQGGSTITQQVVKNLLLTPEKSIQRKVKEAVLSYRLERVLSKDDILEIYLNQIFFGEGAYGLKAAARGYFRKQLSELTLAEAAILAGLPQAPSRYSPTRHFSRAKDRQRYVLSQMVRAGFVTDEAAKLAEEEELTIYPRPQRNVFSAPYYVAAVKRVLKDELPELNAERAGLKITTYADVEAHAFGELAVKRGVQSVDRRVGWRGPLSFFEEDAVQNYESNYELPERINSVDAYPALVLSAIRSNSARIKIGDVEGTLSLASAKWAKRFVDKKGEVRGIRLSQYIKPGAVVEVRLSKDRSLESNLLEEGMKFVLSQTPKLQGALAALKADTGEVRAIIGGYDYRLSQFNRVTQANRQPGSSFKPIVYLSAIDGFDYSPATIVFDAPRQFRVGDDVWEPGNFDDSFLGGITMRNALEKSRNLASADIIAKIGVDSVIRYSRLLGITAPLNPNLSLALGSNEVPMIELLQAYAVIANGGVATPARFIQRIENRDGEVLFDGEQKRIEESRRVVRESSAFVLANMMKGVVETGTGWRVRELGKPAGGKTGTSNEFMDAWFTGFTPDWVCGVWVGYDVKRTIGDKETGGRVSAPIWLEFMSPFLEKMETERIQTLREEERVRFEELGLPYVEPEETEVSDFIPPEGVVPIFINKETGEPASEEIERPFLEYFVAGTEPRERTTLEQASSYLESPDL